MSHRVLSCDHSDAPRQLGFHWRSEGALAPPDGFTFVTNYIEVGNGYVVAESNGNVIVYDSVSSASRILNIDTSTIRRCQQWLVLQWFYMEESRPLEFTRMHDAPAPLDIRLYPITSTLLKLAVNRVGRAKS
jgi:hypothetical protein